MKFAKTFWVKGTSERAFELTEKYVQGMKFKIRNEVKPNLMVLERGSSWGSFSSFKVENQVTTLTISFKQVDDNVSILCDYDITGYGQIYTSSDKSTLESEVEKLHDFLLSAGLLASYNYYNSQRKSSSYIRQTHN